jgi:hypothetical protein
MGSGARTLGTKDAAAGKAGASFRKTVFAAFIVMSLGSFAGGCRKVATAFDCQAVCARYRDCVDIKYDVGACRQRCRQEAAANPKFERKADACESCIKGHSCMGATFECGGQCLGVVP